MSALDHDAADLAWGYIKSVSGMYEATLFHYHFTDRRHGRISVAPDLAREIPEYFYVSYADLSCGYTSNLEKRSKHDPQSLKTHPE